MVWPCRIPEWIERGGDGVMERCVELGRECVRGAWEGDEVGLREGVLGGLFKMSREMDGMEYEDESIEISAQGI